MTRTAASLSRMTDGSGRQSEESTLRWWLRSSRDDIADELKFVGVFLLGIVPAGLVGYLVDGTRGAFYGAVVGAALVVVWMAVSLVRIVADWVRRRRSR